MTPPSPKQIKIKDKNKLFIKWKDGTESEIGLIYLRDECPCATCKGETVLMRTYRPSRKKPHPDMYSITEIKPVGSYAIQLVWKDGHNTGIYTYGHLKELAEDERFGRPHDYEDLV